MSQQTVEYRAEGDDTILIGSAAYPQGDGPHPVVMVGHTWAGCDDFVKYQADRLAQLGYIGFALDMYGGGEVSNNLEDNKAKMGALFSDRALLRKRLLAALLAARNLPAADTSRIGGIGYCFGGLCMLDLVRAGAVLNGVVSLHGALEPTGLANSKIQTPVLVLHGDMDTFIPPEHLTSFVAEVNESGVDWQMHTYGHAMHGFTSKDSKPDLGIEYDEKAERRSWQSVQNFLAEVFDV